MAKQGVDKETLRLIKQVILEEAEKLGVKIEKIILFGSRARGEAKPDSDYDILVVVKGEISPRKIFKLQSRVRTKLYKLLHSELDLLIVEKKRYDARRELWGSIEHTAAKEGVVV